LWLLFRMLFNESVSSARDALQLMVLTSVTLLSRLGERGFELLHDALIVRAELTTVF
jgi:hypothetical protein